MTHTPVTTPADALEGTRYWFAYFNQHALERGLKLEADLPTIPELRADARSAATGFLRDYNNSIADILETDVRLLGLRAIVGDYSIHPDRSVVRMHAHDFRKALIAQIAAEKAAQTDDAYAIAAE